MNLIDINLIPAELRKKKRSRLLEEGLKIPLEMFVGIIAIVVVSLIALHIFVLFLNINKLSVRKDLENKWLKMQPDKGQVDQVMDEINKINTKIKSIEQMTASSNVSWSKKLNILSDILPRGVWLKRITLDNGQLLISGSAISSQEKGMMEVHEFASKLKSDKDFLINLSEIEVGSIKRRNINKTEVSDFLLMSEIK